MDPIADMLTRIRNAQMVSHMTVSIPYSRVKMAILKVLKEENFISQIEKKGKKIRKHIVVGLKYDKSGDSRISAIMRVSKPGKRIYKKAKEIYPVRQNFGIMVMSTPKGFLTGQEARKRKLGGEVICKIW